jgi:hypothetical protein
VQQVSPQQVIFFAHAQPPPSSGSAPSEPPSVDPPLPLLASLAPELPLASLPLELPLASLPLELPLLASLPLELPLPEPPPFELPLAEPVPPEPPLPPWCPPLPLPLPPVEPPPLVALEPESPLAPSSGAPEIVYDAPPQLAATPATSSNKTASMKLEGRTRTIARIVNHPTLPVQTPSHSVGETNMVTVVTMRGSIDQGRCAIWAFAKTLHFALRLRGAERA